MWCILIWQTNSQKASVVTLLHYGTRLARVTNRLLVKQNKMGESVESCLGSLNYVQDDAEPTLHRNGKIYTKRLEDGTDTDLHGVQMTPVLKRIHNARQLPSHLQPTTDRNAFQLVSKCAPPDDIDFLNADDITLHYYTHCEQLVKQYTGASHVFAFDHNVRSASETGSKQQIRNGQQVISPASIVHGDYTLTSSKERLAQLTKPPRRNDTFAKKIGTDKSLVPAEVAQPALQEGRRFAIINVWRNLKRDEKVYTKPLALCNFQTVSTKELAVLEIHYADRIGENYFAKHLDAHEWWYFPEIDHDEAILLKTWDSEGTFAKSDGARPDASDEQGIATFALHSATHLADTPADSPPRLSMEVRCMVLY